MLVESGYRFLLRNFLALALRQTDLRYAVGVMPCMFLKSRTKCVFEPRPTCFTISLTVRNVVRNIPSAFRRRKSLRYCAGLVPVSCLKRCRKRDGDRLTMLASVAVSHEREVSASISEMTSSILRSIVMRTVKRRVRVRVPLRVSFVYRKYCARSSLGPQAARLQSLSIA